MDPRTTDTAHRAWDLRWRSEAGRGIWTEPDDEVLAVAEAIPGRRGPRHPSRALDVGCGIGRHALALAARGLRVCALDASESGIAAARERADHLGLEVEWRRGRMTSLPWKDGAFDHAVAWNVVYHGDGAIVRRTVAEVRRVLRPGALFHATLLSKKHVSFARGREIAPDTWVDETAHDDKSHPHFYTDAVGVRALFEGFALLSFAQREHRAPGTWHWHVLAQRRDAH